MFVPMTRIFAVAMAAVLCFALLVPLALQRHNPALAVVVSGIFGAYAVINIYLWRRYPVKR